MVYTQGFCALLVTAMSPLESGMIVEEEALVFTWLVTMFMLLHTPRESLQTRRRSPLEMAMLSIVLLQAVVGVQGQERRELQLPA
jgi:hypothetical protein